MIVQETNRHRLFIDNIQAGALIFGADGLVVLCNEEASRLLGYPVQVLEGAGTDDQYWHFITEDGTPLPAGQHPVGNILQNNQPVKKQVLGIVPPGEDTENIQWVEISAWAELDDDGDLRNVVMVMWDITSQKMAEENFRLKRIVFESSTEGILLTKIKNGEASVICANPEFTNITGFTEASITGKDIGLLRSPLTDPALFSVIFQKIKDNAAHETTVRLAKFDGSPFWASVRIAPAPDDLGRVTHYIWHFSDVTAQKEINLEMVNSRQVLEQAQKVARMGNFVLDMKTHSIVASDSFDEILGLDKNLPKTVQNCLGHILPEFSAKIWARLQEILTKGGRFSEDFITIRPIDGEPRWISAFAELNHVPETDAITLCGVIQDITERKQAEAAAAHAQSDLESIISTFPDILLRFNGSFQFTYCHSNNPTDSLMPDEHWIGKSMEEVLPAKIASRMIEKSQKTRTSGRVETFEFSMGDINAEKEWFEARLVNAAQEEIVCVIRNITEQKRAEDALKENEQLLRDIFNLAPVPLVISSVVDGKIVMVNAALEKLMGRPFADFKDYSTSDFYQKATDRAAILQQMSTQGHVRNLEVQLKGLSGEIKPCILSSKLVTMDGEPYLFSGIVDISERKNAEEAHRLNEQLLRDVFNFSPIALIITQIEDGKIMMANESAGKLAGLRADEIIGRQVSDFYAYQEDRDKLLQHVLTYGKVNGMEIRLKNVTNNINSGLVSTSIINMHGERMLFTGFIDISERKKMEQELNRSLDLVTEQNKRLLNFSYIVSHNLRSHTSNISTILDFLDNVTSTRERDEMVRHLRTVTSRLDDTLYDLNEVVSIQKNINLIIQPLYLYEYAGRALQVLSEQIHAKKTTIHNLIPNDIVVTVNPAYLESILLNLLSNAIKYSHPGRPSHITMKAETAGEKVVFEISDNGLGIDLIKNRDKIFGMYKTFHGNKDAKGLGLFITKNQVEAMGGTVEVASEPQIGTTFKVILP